MTQLSKTEREGTNISYSIVKAKNGKIGGAKIQNYIHPSINVKWSAFI